jgi:uncharacterized phage infection (PIP) family protein YhgE
MSTQEIQSITDLSAKIDSLTVIIQDGFTKVNQRLNKVEDSIVTLDRRLLVVATKLESIDKGLETVENKLPDISEKFGELKNWRGCRLNRIQAFISPVRQISFIIIAAVAGWLVRAGKL